MNKEDPSRAQVGEYYSTQGFTDEDHLTAIRNSEKYIIGYLIARTGIDPSTRTYCEIGIGRGYSALAAARRFKVAYGIDFDLRHATRVLQTTGWPENFHVRRTLEGIAEKIDVLMAWHVIEHLPRPLAFLEEARRRMNRAGYFFCQVPLFRPAYVVHSHYIFFNETAMCNLMRNAGMSVFDISFDVDLGFLTVIAKVLD